VHTKGVVEVTGSFPLCGCDDYGPKNAVDFESGETFISNVTGEGDSLPRGAWLCYDFKRMRVIPKQYTIRTHNNPAGKEHLKSWIVETSEDGDKWEIIDRRDDNHDLNGFRFIHTFDISSQTTFRFIRLTNIGLSHHKNWMIEIEAWEIFGTLLE
jgi:hypothetical protein